MTVSEIFAKISERQDVGIAMHFDMADYFDFLNLHGFKRIQEYQYLCESVNRRCTHRYFINHYQKQLKINSTDYIAVIPSSWFNYSRADVDTSTMKKSVKDAFEMWVKWEEESKKLYENMYSELVKIGEIAAAMKVKELICDVDMELKYAYRLHLDIKASGYEPIYILGMQDCLHEEYDKKTKEIGVSIC